MTFKNNKCIKISKSEYEDIQFIHTISSCQANALSNVKEYLIKDRRIDLKLDDFTICEIAYNLYMAVMYNYKYMKVEEN